MLVVATRDAAGTTRDAAGVTRDAVGATREEPAGIRRRRRLCRVNRGSGRKLPGNNPEYLRIPPWRPPISEPGREQEIAVTLLEQIVDEAGMDGLQAVPVDVPGHGRAARSPGAGPLPAPGR